MFFEKTKRQRKKNHPTVAGRKISEFQMPTFLSYLLHFFMQQMLLCISYCILNHSDNQESIHLFARERSMNTHTHSYLLTQKHTIMQHSNIWNELWPVFQTTTKKYPSNNNQEQPQQSSGPAHEINKPSAIKHRPRPASWKLRAGFFFDGILTHTSYMIYNGLAELRMKAKNKIYVNAKFRMYIYWLYSPFGTPKNPFQRCHLRSQSKKPLENTHTAGLSITSSSNVCLADMETSKQPKQTIFPIVYQK